VDLTHIAASPYTYESQKALNGTIVQDWRIGVMSKLHEEGFLLWSRYELEGYLVRSIDSF
jgi:hypothetical protein